MNINLSQMKKVARQQRLEREHLVGKPRAKSWSGKPDAKTQRRNWRKDRNRSSWL